MAITKPAVLPVWADSGDKVQPSNTEIQTGWPLSNVPPARQRFNWFFNYVSNAVRYFSRRGLPDWDSAETYMSGDIGIGDDGKIYRSKIDSNLNNVPSSSPSAWELSISSLADMAGDLQKQTYTAFTTGGTAPNYTLDVTPSITSYTAGQRFRVKVHAGSATGVAKTLNIDGLGAKNFVMRNDVGTLSNVQLVTDQLVDVEYDGVQFVMLSSLAITGADNTKTGVARFGTSPEILAAVAGVIMSPQNFAGNINAAATGHVSLPGGLTFNWGFAISNPTNGAASVVTFDKPFTVETFGVLHSFGPVSPTSDITSPLVLESFTLSTATLRSHSAADNGFFYLAIGI